MSSTVDVYLEVTAKRSFACAVDWPGWDRAGRTPEDALAALAAYASRYAVIAAEAGHPLARGVPDLHVVERLEGTSGTGFGVPERLSRADAADLTASEAGRRADLVAAAWTVFDRVVAAAPASLRKGPRGGGRDRDKVVAHVVEAEASFYARQLGLPVAHPDPADADAVAAVRGAIQEVLRAARSGAPLRERGWTPRYAARRIAWHVVDHAWEIEDRSES
ncbi:MAG: hypothetical protein QOE92_1474 [Chloroflexota bacterium]|jgi:hypothetical protein|nr:hypothetical protein [Chloroflexota bacterium]